MKVLGAVGAGSLGTGGRAGRPSGCGVDGGGAAAPLRGACSLGFLDVPVEEDTEGLVGVVVEEVEGFGGAGVGEAVGRHAVRGDGAGLDEGQGPIVDLRCTDLHSSVDSRHLLDICPPFMARWSQNQRRFS